METAFWQEGTLARQALPQVNPYEKLHLGCGPRYIPGFFHVDLLPAPHVDQVAPVERLDFIPNDTVGLIYASHVLEHFGRHQVEEVLREWHRVLRPGGVLRLAVPDFEAVVAVYLEQGLDEGPGILGLVCGGQKDELDYHKMIFDRPLLTRLLKRVGFREVRPWDWRRTEHAHVDDFSQAYLPHLDKENGRLMSLNLEGVK